MATDINLRNVTLKDLDVSQKDGGSFVISFSLGKDRIKFIVNSMEEYVLTTLNDELVSEYF